MLRCEDCYGVVEAADEKEAEEKVKAHLAKTSIRGASMIMVYEINLEEGAMVFCSEYKGD